MKKKPFNWGTYITLIGVVVIFFIIFTDTIDTIYILPVLGAICLVYGIFGLVQSRSSNEAGLSQRSMLQLDSGRFRYFHRYGGSTSSESDTAVLGYFSDYYCDRDCDLDVFAETKVSLVLGGLKNLSR